MYTNYLRIHFQIVHKNFQPKQHKDYLDRKNEVSDEIAKLIRLCFAQQRPYCSKKLVKPEKLKTLSTSNGNTTRNITTPRFRKYLKCGRNVIFRSSELELHCVQHLKKKNVLIWYFKCLLCQHVFNTLQIYLVQKHMLQKHSLQRNEISTGKDISNRKDEFVNVIETEMMECFNHIYNHSVRKINKFTLIVRENSCLLLFVNCAKLVENGKYRMKNHVAFHLASQTKIEDLLICLVCKKGKSNYNCHIRRHVRNVHLISKPKYLIHYFDNNASHHSEFIYEMLY